MTNERDARNSGKSVEWYTPADIVEAARELMGGIDLDPASCQYANRVVRAHHYYDKECDGLGVPWYGNIFLNPPGGLTADNKSSTKEWWFKLAREFQSDRVKQAVFVGFSMEILQTTQVKPPALTLLPANQHLCFPARRLRCYNEQTDGHSPPHASVIVYLGENISRFYDLFGKFGICR